MRKYGYKRPSATLYVKRRRTVRTKKPSFFSRFFSRFIVLLLVGVALFVGGRYAWRAFSQAQFTNWQVKAVSVSGITGPREQEIFKTASQFTGKTFSMTDAQKLERQFSSAYPMLTDVGVSRGLFSGTLKISASPRQAVARFVLPDHSYKYLDNTSTVYDDPSGPRELLQIELEGEVPSQLPATLVDWVENIIKLKKSLPFEALHLTMPAENVIMRLKDGTVIRFGSADRLKDKAARAVEIIHSAQSAYTAPFVLDFTYFDKGKVFLTHSSY